MIAATSLVQKEREVKTMGGVKRLGKALNRPLQKFKPKAIVSYFLWLPLNFVPVVGTVMFLLVQGELVRGREGMGVADNV